MVFYDKTHGRLVYINTKADEKFWDTHWNFADNERRVRKVNRLVLTTTKKYLSPPSRVIDAGCGLAHSVFSLHCAGYESYGIDFAEKTIDFVKIVASELNVIVSDVRRMHHFPDDFFDGYWSLGVIEHFFEGYESIVKEAFRTIRQGGYAFVTVPTMSPLRRLKAWLNIYPSFEGQSAEGFYQFALPDESVIQNFKLAGFSLVATSSLGGFKGLKDEIKPLTHTMQLIYDNNRYLLSKILILTVDRLCSWFAGHTRLYVFRKP